MTPLLDAGRVRFAFNGRPILDGVSLRVRSGEFVGLVGPNGAGKSTFLKAAIGLLRADGEIRLDGHDIAALTRTEIARRAAFVPQDTGIGSGFTAYEVVAMGRFPYLGRFKPDGPEDIDAIERAFAATETADLRDRRVNEISGGERQRVVIARALAQATPLLVLDEPTANLDLAHQIDILALVRRLCDEGRAALAALHDLASAARYCDRIAIIHDGRIVADGPPADVVIPENLKRWFGVRAVVRRACGHLVIVPLAAERTAAV